jgi:hypothetical protein
VVPLNREVDEPESEPLAAAGQRAPESAEAPVRAQVPDLRAQPRRDMQGAAPEPAPRAMGDVLARRLPLPPRPLACATPLLQRELLLFRDHTGSLEEGSDTPRVPAPSPLPGCAPVHVDSADKPAAPPCRCAASMPKCSRAPPRRCAPFHLLRMEGPGGHRAGSRPPQTRVRSHRRPGLPVRDTAAPASCTPGTARRTSRSDTPPPAPPRSCAPPGAPAAPGGRSTRAPARRRCRW